MRDGVRVSRYKVLFGWMFFLIVVVVIRVIIDNFFLGCIKRYNIWVEF